MGTGGMWADAVRTQPITQPMEVNVKATFGQGNGLGRMVVGAQWLAFTVLTT